MEALSCCCGSSKDHPGNDRITGRFSETRVRRVRVSLKSSRLARWVLLSHPLLSITNEPRTGADPGLARATHDNEGASSFWIAACPWRSKTTLMTVEKDVAGKDTCLDIIRRPGLKF